MFDENAPHNPVLIGALIEALAPIQGVWVDGTFGAGGYARALCEAGAEMVLGIDRDPQVHQMAQSWLPAYKGRIRLVEGAFSDMAALAQASGLTSVDGVVLDIGVSSMQIDQAERGFSFQKDGALDMRMSQKGPTAAQIVNEASPQLLADILYHYGEERAARRIARAIVAARAQSPIENTLQLAEIVASVLPKQRQGQIHPATRTFQALRVAVNDEFMQLAQGLSQAELLLRPGGFLAVVSFHSLEDRMVKRFFQAAEGEAPRSRHMAPTDAQPARFERVIKRAIQADEAELSQNPRARSAKLRIGRRTAAASAAPDIQRLGMPQLPD